MITVSNISNGPFDLYGGLRLGVNESVTSDFPDAYVKILRASHFVKVEDGGDLDPKEKALSLGIKVDGRWSEQRLAEEIKKALDGK